MPARVQLRRRGDKAQEARAQDSQKSHSQESDERLHGVLVSKSSIREYFERVAPVWEYWQRRNRYYHNAMANLVAGMIPPGAEVLELGTGTGDLLASLKPARGMGLNFTDTLTERAREKHPEFEFATIEVDSVRMPHAMEPQYVVMNNMLDYVYDAWDILESLRPTINEQTLLIATTNNPMWAPILRLASKLGMRIPESTRNFITNKDICGVLHLQGFDVVEEGLILPVPVRVPLIGPLLNALLPELPVVRFMSSIQYLAARRRETRRPLSVSVVVPCHNEEENIVECIRRVPHMGAATEIVIVDDGSTDGTAEKVKEVMAGDARVRLIMLEKNQGKATAVAAGFEASKGDVLMILDADMAVAPEELPKFLKPLHDGTADFVNGTRLVYPMQGKAMRIANFFGNKAFCYLASKVIRQRVSDTLCGTKAFLKRDYLRMPLGGKERWGDFDLLFGAARLRLRILEIPVHYTERRAGKSKMRVMVDGWYFLFACISGWRMLRFPEKHPWAKKRPPVTGVYEVKPAAQASAAR